MAHHTTPEEAATASFLASRAVIWLTRLCGALSAATILAILAVVAYAIVWRYLLATPLRGVDELIGYLLVATVMLGGAEALRRGDHISIDLLTARAGERMAPILHSFADAAVVAFAVVLGASAWDSVVFAWGFGSYSPGYLEAPAWLVQSPLIPGAALLGLTALARIVERHFGAGRG